MKLIECYVENFGCLEKFSYRFEEGLTTINQMNGWGKSTFAAFLRSMLYGLPKSTKRNLNENERVKYTPWNGSRMGGNLVFEVDGKRYKMERFFEKKEKDDIFVLYDLATNMESQDFTANIGEELFGIDLDAYAKSAYISQNSIEIGTNDSINAKLGNLLDSDNDINNFDKAIKKLKEAKKEYKKTGGRGRIGELEKEITSKKIELEKTDVKKEALRERVKQIKEIQENKEVFQEKLKEVKVKIGEAASYDGHFQKKKQYEETKKNLEKQIEDTKEVLAFFKEELPTEKDLSAQKERIVKLEQEIGKQKSFELTEEEVNNKNLFENRIGEGVFSEDTLSSMDGRARKIRELSIKIEEAKLTPEEIEAKEKADIFFAGELPEDHMIESYNDQIAEIQRLELKIAKREAAEELEPKEVKKESGATVILLLVLGILCFLAGIVAILTPIASIVELIALVIIGAILCGVAMLVRSTKQKRYQEKVQKLEEARLIREDERNKLVNRKEDILADLDAFFDQFVGLNQEESYIQRLMRVRDYKMKYNALIEKLNKIDTDQLEKEQKELEDLLRSFLSKMQEEQAAEMNTWEDGLQNIRTKYNKFLTARKDEEEKKRNREAIERVKQEIALFVDQFKVSRKDDYYASLDEIRKQVEKLEYLHANAKSLESVKLSYEEMKDFDEWKNLEEQNLSLGELRTEERKLEEAKDEALEREKEIQGRIDELLVENDELKEIEQEKLLLEEELERDQKKLEVIEGTIKYLEEAKDLFSSHYLKGLRGAFEKYMDRIGDEHVSGAKLDAKMEVKVEKDGAMRKIGYFSRGNQDLINVCARFALVDALFEEEKPFLVLDDTFVNFDGEKLERVLQLIGEISNKYQIIYLVCHDSRVRDFKSIEHEEYLELDDKKIS